MKYKDDLKNKKILLINISVIVVLSLLLLFLSIFQSSIMVSALESEDIYYCDDLTYSATATSNKVVEEIRYVRKVEEEYLINKSFPNYYNNNNSLTNTCANVAGANIIGYYDRYLENLIPNHSPGIQRPSGYIYQAMTVNMAPKQGVIEVLYDKMKTNTISSGTSQTQYKSGLTSYIKEKGYNIDIRQTMNGTKLDLGNVDNQLRAGNPISLYLKEYNFATVSDSDSVVSIEKMEYVGNHIIIVYGYKKAMYYDSGDNLVATKVYLYIAPGSKSVSNIYILDESGLVDAEAMHVY